MGRRGETKELKIAQGAAFFPEIIFFFYPAVSFDKQDYLFIYLFLPLFTPLFTYIFLFSQLYPSSHLL